MTASSARAVLAANVQQTCEGAEMLFDASGIVCVNVIDCVFWRMPDLAVFFRLCVTVHLAKLPVSRFQVPVRNSGIFKSNMVAGIDRRSRRILELLN
ncbi:hypothetical protein PALU110988_05775 [Paenibacillus lupini]